MSSLFAFALRPFRRLATLILLLLAGLSIQRVAAQTDPLLLTLSEPLPHASVGRFYDQIVGSGSGGGTPYHFQLVTGGGFPPIGIIMDINGRLSGTAKTPGTYDFTVSLVDLGGNHVEQVAELIVDPPNFAVSDASVAEGNSGQKYLTFIITLNGKTNQTAIVTWSTIPGTARGARVHRPGIDYQSVFATRVTFLPGQTRKRVKVLVYGDRTIEPDETFFVRLSHPIHATISRNIGIGTIINDDFPPTPPTPPSPPAIHITSVVPVVTGHTSLYTDYTVTVNGTTTGTPGYYTYEAGYGNFGQINTTLTYNPEYWSFHFDYTQFNGGPATVMPIWADIYDSTGTKAADQTSVTLPY